MSNGAITALIDGFESTSKEGPSLYSQACSSPLLRLVGKTPRCSAFLFLNPLFVAAVTPFAMRPLTGLHGNQIEEIVGYMTGSETKLSVLQSKGRNLKKDRLWDILYLHPNNNIFQQSKHMCPCFQRCIFRFCCASRVLQTATSTVTINHHEMQRIRKLLGRASRSTKLNLGRWNGWQQDPYPSWESVRKAPLWSNIEWADLRSA